MMKLIKKNLFNNSVSPLYEKLSIALKRKVPELSISEVFYIGGEKFSQDRYQLRLELLKKTSSIEQLNDLKFDIQSDNIEYYLIVDREQKSYLVILFDPYEPLFQEEILDFFPFEKESLKNIEAQKIF